MNLDAYFDRIGYTGPRAPTLEVLRTLELRHTTTIAFENLNPMLRLPVSLDLPSLEEKLVRGGRGGWCFEQNLLFMEVLRTLGFRVVALAARVMWNVPEGVVTSRNHMLLKVHLDGRDYIADVGFGGQTLTGPVLLEAGTEQSTPHEPFRLMPQGDEYRLETKIAGQWKAVYRFDLQPQLPQDYEVSNHYLCTHPGSYFLTRLFVARPTSDRRYGLFDNTLSIHRQGAPSEQITLKTVGEMREVLVQTFGLTLPAGPELDDMLAWILAKPPSAI